MRSKLMVVLLAGFLVTSFSLCLMAQEKEVKAELYWVREISLDPSMADDFKTNMKEFVTQCKKYNFPYTWYTWVDEGGNFLIFMTVKSYDEGKIIYEKFGEIHKKWKNENEAQYKEWWKVNDAIEWKYYKDYHLQFLPKYSYIPENPRLKPEEAKFAIWDMFHLTTGKVNDFLKLLKELNLLCKKKNFTGDTICLAGRAGTKRPLYIGCLLGKDISDFWMENKKMWQLLGKEGGEIFKKIQSLVENRRWRHLWYLKNLSYEVKKEKETK